MKSLAQLAVLLFGIQIFGVCCTPLGREETLTTNEPQNPSAESVADQLQLAENDGEIVEENFYRLVRESSEDRQAYRLLKTTSELLHDKNEMIDLMEETIQNLEILIGSNQRANAILGKPKTADLDLREIKERETRAKKSYADLAIVYNRKMEEVEYKFTKQDGLPPGETEILPKFFPIR